MSDIVIEAAAPADGKAAKKAKKKGGKLKKLILLFVALIVIGGAGGGVIAWLSSRSSPAKAPIDAAPDKADPWNAPSHQTGPDPWANGAPPPVDAGGYDFSGVGDQIVTSPRGFSLNVPAGYTSQILGDGTILATNIGGTALVVAPVDPKQAEAMVQKHVAETHLPVLARRTINVNGVQRPLVLFGREANSEYGQYAVAEASVGFFTGKVTYAVTMHLQGATVNDPEAQRLFQELIEKRVKP